MYVKITHSILEDYLLYVYYTDCISDFLMPLTHLTEFLTPYLFHTQSLKDIL